MTKPDPKASRLVHATCIDIEGRGILIRGAPGSGKSDLALRLIDQPGRGVAGSLGPAVLVSDDQVALWRKGGEIWAQPPEKLEGLMEIRGLGIMRVPYRSSSILRLVVDLTKAELIERLPEPFDLIEELLGVTLPALSLDPQFASAPARVRAALENLSVQQPSVLSTPPTKELHCR
jgi:serine kinase of HPr protein (carbohydrate metabolism regulator)